MDLKGKAVAEKNKKDIPTLLCRDAFIDVAGSYELAQQIIIFLNNFPEVKDNSLALDRSFEDDQDKLNAVMRDMTNQSFPRSRINELLYVNLFERSELQIQVEENSREDAERIVKTVNVDAIKSRTFFAHALAKEPIPSIKILEGMRKTLGDAQFFLYMKTPNYLAYTDDIGGVSHLKISTIDLYLKNHGIYNQEERNAFHNASEASKAFLRALEEEVYPERKQNVIDINNVDTHNTSSNVSANTSHVTAFEMMLGSTPELKQGLQIDFRNAENSKIVGRTVKIQGQKDKLNGFVQQKILDLKTEVDHIVTLGNEDLYNKWIRYTDANDFQKQEYSDLKAKDKEYFDLRIDGWRFKIEAAKRYIDDMTTHHKIQGAYAYETRAANTCGLTMEEMIATAYWASKDTSNFKKDAASSNTKEKLPLLLLLNQIYDMKRGYDIDRGIDKPEESQFPSPPSRDQNRCAGGSINSLS